MTTLSSMRLGAELFVQTFMPGFGKETIPLETFTQVITATTDQINSQLLEADRSDPRNKAILNMMQNDYFADRVAKTDWVDFTVTLKDGTVINIITNTQFTDKDGDTIFYQVDGNGIFQTLEDLESSLTEEEAKKILEKNTSLEFNLTTYEGVMKKMKELAKSDLFKFKQHTKDGSILVTKSDIPIFTVRIINYEGKKTYFIYDHTSKKNNQIYHKNQSDLINYLTTKLQ